MTLEYHILINSNIFLKQFLFKLSELCYNTVNHYELFAVSRCRHCCSNVITPTRTLPSFYVWKHVIIYIIIKDKDVIHIHMYICTYIIFCATKSLRNIIIFFQFNVINTEKNRAWIMITFERIQLFVHV